MPGTSRSETYTLELAEEHIGDLRGATDILGEAHTKTDATDYPDTPAGGLIAFSAAGHEKYVSSDGVSYNTGRNTNGATSALTFTTSLQTVPGLSLGLGVGTYRIHAQILVNNPAGTGQGAISVQATGSGGLTVSNGRISATEIVASTASAWADYNTVGNLLTSANAPGNNTFNRVWTVDGYLIVSVAGTLSIQMKQAATVQCNSVLYGTYLESMPIS